jgi:hypothetical protein
MKERKERKNYSPKSTVPLLPCRQSDLFKTRKNKKKKKRKGIE